MVYRSISADMKRRALQLLADGWELHEIAGVLGVSPKSIDRWHDNYETLGRVDPLSFLRGRRRILSADVVEDLRDLIQETPELYLDEIGEWLALYHEVQISMTALHENLRDLGLTHKLMRRAAAERDHELRANWMYDILNTYTAEQMVILDESSKDDRTLIRKYGRGPSGDDPIFTVSLDRGIRYSILPALTVDGYIAARAVEGSVDGEEFFDFIVNDLVSRSSCIPPDSSVLKGFSSLKIPCTNPFPEPHSVFIMDNCATHKSDALREVIESAGRHLVFLPPYSPDFSPIEESFSCGMFLVFHAHNCQFMFTSK